MLAAAVPLPPAWVERAYSRGVYPAIQNRLTSFSNTVAISLFDVALVASAVGLVTWWSVRLAAGRGHRLRVALGLAGTTLVCLASTYLLFLALWGLNYRREHLATRLDFDRRRVTRDNLLALASTTAFELNDLHAALGARAWPGLDDMPRWLGPAFLEALRVIEQPDAVPGRPKRSVLSVYFQRAAIDGMTDPFFLETLVRHDLLPFERPFVVAHEWAHLAGFADESEASFVGWLTALKGGLHARYSAGLFLFMQMAGDLDTHDRAAVERQLRDGPRADIAAVYAKYRQQTAPAARALSRFVYDRFLRANRVRAGIRSYDAVVTLILGTRFRPGMTPIMRGDADLNGELDTEN